MLAPEPSIPEKRGGHPYCKEVTDATLLRHLRVMHGIRNKRGGAVSVPVGEFISAHYIIGACGHDPDQQGHLNEADALTA